MAKKTFLSQKTCILILLFDELSQESEGLCSLFPSLIISDMHLSTQSGILSSALHRKHTV